MEQSSVNLGVIPISNGFQLVGGLSTQTVLEVSGGGVITLVSGGTAVYTYPGVSSNVFTDAVGTITSDQLRAALTNETGTGGGVVFATAPTITNGVFVTPAIGVATGTTLFLNPALTSTEAFKVTVGIEAQPRFVVYGNGEYHLGDGTSPVDTSIRRTAAGVLVYSGGAAAMELRLLEASGGGTNYVGIKTPNVTTSYTMTLPVAVGAAGTFLRDLNGTGVLDWAAVTTSPAGSDTQVQFNDGGAFGGDAGLVYNKTTNNLQTGFIGVGSANDGSAYIEVKTLTGGSNIQGFRAEADNVGNIQFSTFITADAQVRFRFAADGSMGWGSGAAVVDTLLSRGAAGTLDLKATSGSAPTLRIFEDPANGGEYTAFKAQSQVASITYTLPAALTATGSVLADAGTGTLAWQTTLGRYVLPLPVFDAFTSDRIWSDANSYTTGTVVGGSSSGNYGSFVLTTNGSGNKSTMYSRYGTDLVQNEWNSNPELLGMVRLTSTTAAAFVSWFAMGGNTGSTGPDAAGAWTVGHIGFILDQATLYASNAGGGTQTRTDITGTLDMTKNHLLRATVVSGASVKFYVDGVLVATHTTNIPSGGFASESPVTMGITNDSGVATARSLGFSGGTVSWNA